jgi:hypothetical protein
MALTPGEGGGGMTMGGTASSICAISPSDTASTIGNLLERIEALELALSQVLGANLHANTLGDISSQVGWVYGVEYMGIPGWIQTEYGTLIPPAGFTLSGSGIQMWNACTGEFEDYQAVVMDENGVLQWGASAAGNLCGAKVEEWNDAAAVATPPDYAISKYKYDESPTRYNNNRGITITTQTPSSEGLATLTVSQAGVYLVTSRVMLQSASSGVACSLEVSVPNGSQNAGDIHSTTAGVLTWHTTSVFNLAAGDAINMLFDAAGSIGAFHLSEFSAYRIGSSA